MDVLAESSYVCSLHVPKSYCDVDGRLRCCLVRDFACVAKAVSETGDTVL